MKKLLILAAAMYAATSFAAVVKIQENFATTNTPANLTNIIESMAGGAAGLQTGNSTDATNVNLTVTGTLVANNQSNTTLITDSAYFPYTNAGATFDGDGKLTSSGGVTQAGLAAGSYPIDGGALIFSELYSAWVSKSGDNSTGTVGKRERPFAGVSNAVYAVKTALGSVNTNGVVYVGAGLFAESLVNLQRTNLTAISLIGEGEATMLTQVAAATLNNTGPLVYVGNNTRVVGICISNDMSASVKQAAIGWDTTRSSDLGSTIVVSTNVYINVPIGRGSSDVGYFYDTSSSIELDVWIDGCDWESKWDCFFDSNVGFAARYRITRSNFRVAQPDDYNFPGGGSGSGRARTVLISSGFLNIENSSIVAIGGVLTSNETSALTYNGSEYFTNINTAIHAESSGAGTVTHVFGDYFVNGKQSPSIVTTNTAFSGSIAVATSGNTAKATRDASSLTNYGGIKVYRALLTQTGTAAPAATVLENSLGGTPTWARTGIGVYTCNTSTLFPSGKTLARVALHAPNIIAGATLEYATTSQIILRTTEEIGLGTETDAVLATGSNIEILVYP